MTAERRDRTGDQRLEVLAFANLTRDFRSHTFIRRAFHQPQLMAHLRFGKQIQKWRLLQLNRQTLLEHLVEDFITSLIIEIGKQYRVFFRQRGLAVEVSPDYQPG